MPFNPSGGIQSHGNIYQNLRLEQLVIVYVTGHSENRALLHIKWVGLGILKLREAWLDEKRREKCSQKQAQGHTRGDLKLESQRCAAVYVL